MRQFDHCPLMALFIFKAAREFRSQGKEYIARTDDMRISEIVADLVDHQNADMIKVLKWLLRKNAREQAEKKPSIAKLKQPNSRADFRAVKIAPSSTCCAAATQIRGKSYLLRDAPRLPLLGCTMPLYCSCKFRKNADRRDSDRRRLGFSETNRWFAGLENRKRASRRSVEE